MKSAIALCVIERHTDFKVGSRPFLPGVHWPPDSSPLSSSAGGVGPLRFLAADAGGAFPAAPRFFDSEPDRSKIKLEMFNIAVKR